MAWKNKRFWNNAVVSVRATSKGVFEEVRGVGPSEGSKGTTLDVAEFDGKSYLCIDGVADATFLKVTVPPTNLVPPYMVVAVVGNISGGTQVIVQNNGNAAALKNKANQFSWFASSANHEHFTASLYNDGFLHGVVYMMRGDLSTDKVFVDGIDDTGTIENAAGTSYTLATWEIGNASADLAMFHVVLGDFSDDECAQLSRNPFSIYEQIGHRIALSEEVPANTKVDIVQGTRTKPWTKQPPAGTLPDKHHPLLKDIKFYLCTMWGWEYTKDPFHGNRQGINDTLTGSGATFKTTQHGVMWLEEVFATNGDHENFLNWGEVPSGLEGSENATIVWVGDLQPDQGSDNIFMMGKAVGGNNLGVQFSLDRKANDSITAQIADGTNNLTTSTIAGTEEGIKPLGQLDVIAMTWDGTTLRLVVNGEYEYSNTGSVTGGLYAATDRAITMGDYTGSNRDYPYIHAYGFGVDRIMSNGELKALSDNPWQIFEQQKLQVPVQTEVVEFDQVTENRGFMFEVDS